MTNGNSKFIFLALLWRERTKVRVEGVDRGEGALIFCPLTLTLSRQGRGNPSPWLVQQPKYFVRLRLNLVTLWFYLLVLFLMFGPAFAAEVQNLTVVSYPARPAKLPLWLAQDAGLFEKNGLKVTLKELNSSEELIQSMQNREGQIYAATANWLVSGIGDGFDLVFIVNTGYSVIKLVSRPIMNRPEQLRGKKVGTGEANSSQDRITRQTLQRLGLNPDRDVTLVPFGSRSIQRLNALLKGEIDATTSNEDNLFDL